jgi:acyl-CoA synthetase (AMP-forming)/AMP-acid ligase II
MTACCLIWRRYMDTEGYLFITGRSKDVINRGGEIISPVEVEDAVVTHPCIEQVMAFATPHDVLQVCTRADNHTAIGASFLFGAGRLFG